MSPWQTPWQRRHETEMSNSIATHVVRPKAGAVNAQSYTSSIYTFIFVCVYLTVSSLTQFARTTGQWANYKKWQLKMLQRLAVYCIHMDVCKFICIYVCICIFMCRRTVTIVVMPTIMAVTEPSGSRNFRPATTDNLSDLPHFSLLFPINKYLFKPYSKILYWLSSGQFHNSGRHPSIPK